MILIEIHKTVLPHNAKQSSCIIIQDEYGSTALEIACQKGHEIIADKLLMKGANVDYQNKVYIII